MKLYSYWRSSCSWRVRIALNFKGIPHEIVPVHLVRAEHDQAEHRGRNPMGQVPVLAVDEGFLSQSVAILEYLEERYPTPALLPADPWQRAQVRAVVETINSGIQPIQNMAVNRYVAATFGGDAAAWNHHWIGRGLERLEQQVVPGPFAVGATPTFADLCLVPQLYNARRFGCAVEAWPNLLAVEAACLALPAFQAAHPDQQPDAEPTKA